MHTFDTEHYKTATKNRNTENNRYFKKTIDNIRYQKVSFTIDCAIDGFTRL